jgi:hypothetical protein
MTQLYVDAGLVYTLLKLANAGGSGLYWGLFSSNTTPTKGSVFADFTMWNTSYGRKQVAVGSFTLQQVAANIGSIQAPDEVFTNGSGGSLNAYGYIIYVPTTNEIIAAARFDSAPLVVANGGTVVVTPILGDADQSTL